MKFSETRQPWRVQPQLFDLQDRCLSAHTPRGPGRRAALNRNEGVSVQKVAFLRSNSLTPNMTQSWAVNGQGTNWGLPPVVLPREGRGTALIVQGARESLRAPASDIDLLGMLSGR